MRQKDAVDGGIGLHADCLAENCKEDFASISRHKYPANYVTIRKSEHRYFSYCKVVRKDHEVLSCLFGKIDATEAADDKASNLTWRINPTAMAAVSCSGRFKKVDVNVTFAQQAKRDHRRASFLPTAVTAYDRSSAVEAVDQAPYDSNLTDWIKPGTFPRNAPKPGDHVVWSGSALPQLDFNVGTGFELNNFWNALVTRERANGGDVEALLDPGHLAEVTRDLYTIYCTQLINQLRHRARARGSNTVRRIGSVTQQAVRVHQDALATIFLQVTLVIIGTCVVVTFWRFPTKAIVPKAPNSIAAQVSILAKSQFVQTLREEEVISVKTTNVWDRFRFSMRWWSSRQALSSSSSSSSSSSNHKGRWGIDGEPTDQEMRTMKRP